MPENEAYCSDWGTEKCFIKICVLYSFIHISVQWFERFEKNDNVKASTHLYIHILLSFLGAVFFPHYPCKLKLIGGFDDALLLKRVRVYVYTCLSTIHNSLRQPSRHTDGHFGWFPRVSYQGSSQLTLSTPFNV